MIYVVDYIANISHSKFFLHYLPVSNRSGEEGQFPQLTICAETRLRQIAPESRVLQTEEPILTKATLEPGHWDEVSNEVQV